MAAALCREFCVSVAVVPTKSLQENLASRLKKPCQSLRILLVNGRTEVDKFAKSTLGKSGVLDQSYLVLCDFESFGALKLALLQSRCRVGRFIFDEIHQMMEWKDDLRDCSAFHYFLRDFETVSCLLCSATATRKVREEACDFLGRALPCFREIIKTSIRPNIWVRMIPSERFFAVVGNISTRPLLIIVNSFAEKARVNNLLKFVMDPLIEIRDYSGGMASAEKESNQRWFEDAACRGILISTGGAYGTGIDNVNLANVWIWGWPRNWSTLYQYMGRVGRRGQDSTVWIIQLPRDFAKMEISLQGILGYEKKKTLSGSKEVKKNENGSEKVWLSCVVCGKVVRKPKKVEGKWTKFFPMHGVASITTFTCQAVDLPCPAICRWKFCLPSALVALACDKSPGDPAFHDDVCGCNYCLPEEFVQKIGVGDFVKVIALESERFLKIGRVEKCDFGQARMRVDFGAGFYAKFGRDSLILAMEIILPPCPPIPRNCSKKAELLVSLRNMIRTVAAREFIIGSTIATKRTLKSLLLYRPTTVEELIGLGNLVDIEEQWHEQFVLTIAKHQEETDNKKPNKKKKIGKKIVVNMPGVSSPVKSPARKSSRQKSPSRRVCDLNFTDYPESGDEK